jgi:hypothetical protein
MLPRFLFLVLPAIVGLAYVCEIVLQPRINRALPAR